MHGSSFIFYIVRIVYILQKDITKFFCMSKKSFLVLKERYIEEFATISDETVHL